MNSKECKHGVSRRITVFLVTTRKETEQAELEIGAHARGLGFVEHKPAPGRMPLKLVPRAWSRRP